MSSNRVLDAYMTGKGFASGTYAVDFTGDAGNDPDILDFRDDYETPQEMFPLAKDLGDIVTLLGYKIQKII